MDTGPQNVSFPGPVPAHYEEGLGPVIFAPYADHLAKLVAAEVKSGRLLEVACGTGQVTRRLDAALPRGVKITATDLNDGMLAHARAKVAASDRLEWRTA